MSGDLAQLSAFTLGQARALGVPNDATYRMLDAGEIERVGRGVYLRTDTQVDPALLPLIAATAADPRATLCLGSALVWHGLSDEIVARSDIALPRGTRAPAGFTTIAWHHFNPNTFDVGRTRFDPDLGTAARDVQPTVTPWSRSLAIYSPERTIVDSFRLAHLEGYEVATSALRRWLAGPHHSAAALLRVAAAFPQALPRLRSALQVLL